MQAVHCRRPAGINKKKCPRLPAGFTAQKLFLQLLGPNPPIGSSV